MTCAATRPTVPIVATLNKGYLPYLEVMVQSLFAHRNPARSYEVIVASMDIAEADLDPLRRFVAPDGSLAPAAPDVSRPCDDAPTRSGAFSVRLLDLSPLSERIAHVNLSEGFPREIFFRLLLPDAMPGCDRIVYLDSDLVVLDDVAKIFDTDMGDALVCACVDVGMAGMVGGYDPDAERRLRDDLGLADPYGYFSSGVLVWDLAAMRAAHPVDEMLAYLCEHSLRYGDQDALNHFCQGRVHYLDQRWNTLFDSEGIRVSQIVPHAPQALQDAYAEARRNPAVFHYAGPVKPWYTDVDGSDLFWREARRSVSYEAVLRDWLVAEGGLEKGKLLGTIWKTFDDVYFQLSEAERIRHDLHERASRLEAQTSALQGQADELRRENQELRAEVDRVRQECLPLWRRVIRRFRH